MQPSDEAVFWDARYGTPEFAYGKEANVHVTQSAAKYLLSPSLCVELASGEGRNAVHLASLGHTVTAVDFSQSGLDKTRELAVACGCSDRVECVKADITGWSPAAGPGTVDAVIMSFCHLHAQHKRGVFANIVAMLKPGGLLILEVFHPNQIAKGYKQRSGGPADPTMMFTLDELRSLLPGGQGEELQGEELEYELHEGIYHEGLGAVTRCVWRKSAAA